MTGPTAIVAEDEATLRHQLIEQLGQLWPELAIVGEASDGVQALRTARRAPSGRAVS